MADNLRAATDVVRAALDAYLFADTAAAHNDLLLAALNRDLQLTPMVLSKTFMDSASVTQQEMLGLLLVLFQYRRVALPIYCEGNRSEGPEWGRALTTAMRSAFPDFPFESSAPTSMQLRALLGDQVRVRLESFEAEISDIGKSDETDPRRAVLSARRDLKYWQIVEMVLQSDWDDLPDIWEKAENFFAPYPREKLLDDFARDVSQAFVRTEREKRTAEFWDELIGGTVKQWLKDSFKLEVGDRSPPSPSEVSDFESLRGARKLYNSFPLATLGEAVKFCRKEVEPSMVLERLIERAASDLRAHQGELDCYDSLTSLMNDLLWLEEQPTEVQLQVSRAKSSLRRALSKARSKT